jgi:hypothetical protein
MEVIEGQYRLEGEAFHRVQKDQFYNVIGPIQNSTHAADRGGRRWILRSQNRVPVGVCETEYGAVAINIYYLNRRYIRG